MSSGSALGSLDNFYQQTVGNQSTVGAMLGNTRTPAPSATNAPIPNSADDQTAINNAGNSATSGLRGGAATVLSHQGLANLMNNNEDETEMMNTSRMVLGS